MMAWMWMSCMYDVDAMYVHVWSALGGDGIAV